MKNLSFNILIFILVLGSFASLSAQTTIGSLNEPVKGALLEIKQEKGTDINSETVKTGGMLLPRVNLKDLKSLEPTVSELATDYADQKMLHVGLMVYNTTKDDAKSIYEGIYAWNGHEWQFMVSQASEFNLSVSPVNLLVESGYDGQDIKAKSIAVSWLPAGANCTVDVKDILNGGVAINNLPTSLSGGNATINIPIVDITPLNPADIAINPFVEKQSTLSFIVSDGTETRTEKVNITQRHHTLIVRNMPTEAELGETYTIRLASNASWIATSSDAAIQILTPSGNANILGADFEFKVSDLTADEGKDVSITFTSPGGNFSVQTFVIRTFREYPNSYIVTPGEVLQLPVAKAFIVADEVFGTPLTGTFTAELIWQDRLNDAKTEGIITNVSVPASATKSSFITVTTNTGTMTDILSPSMDPSENVSTTTPMMGNAVVALKVNGVIKWSWHIWITDYKPNEALDYDFKNGESDALDVTGGKVVSFYNTAKSTVMMDRDLGGVTGNVQSDLIRGLSYQWGRKDPMGSSMSNKVNPAVTVLRPIYDMTKIALIEQPLLLSVGTYTGLKKVLVAGTGTYLQKSIEEPLTMFIGLSDNGHDWYSAEIDVRNDNLWNNTEGNKAYYDPCPKGWRVPVGGPGTNSVYYSLPAIATKANLSNVYYDYIAQGLGVLSQTAFRYVGTGQATQGPFTWHGSTVAAFAYLNSVDKTLVNVSYPQGRTITTAIRCVKDIKNK